MSSDNRTPRLHSFRIACAIASATLCATAIAQVAFSLKPAIEVLDNPVIADSPAYPALAISTLVPAVIGIATTILSAVLVWTIKSGDPFKKGSATCLKVLEIHIAPPKAADLVDSHPRVQGEYDRPLILGGPIESELLSGILFAHDFEKVSGLATKGEA